MIPIEMTHYPSWIVWRYEYRNDGKKATKIPYSPRTYMRASVTDPSHWSTYNEALQALHSSQHGSFSGIGFVLSKDDPYTVIDLDNPEGDVGDIERAKLILESFNNTYAEVSPSGNGIHIIVRGYCGPGRRRAKIEIYSQERYITMTGATFRDLPIESNDYLLARLYEELGGANHSIVRVEGSSQRFTDEEIYKKACETNEKFLPLFNGEYHQWYRSQSEADFALINLLSFYSRNREQIARMFLYSSLGKRPKAHRKNYLSEMIDKSFDNLAPDISLDQLMGNLHAQIEADKTARTKNPPSMLGEGWSLPPGLVGEIAQFIYSAAPRPVQEIALAGAIALMAGICGRAYNVSNTGLNQYILLLATTGRGKEAAKGGISKLMKLVCATQPNASDFIGPADIASGQALIKYLGTNPCFVSILGEFGLTMQTMCHPHAPAPLVTLRKVLLDLFGKSGKDDTLNPTIYSDKSNNTGIVQSPAFTILGETTPDSFFPHLSEDIVAQGLLPRFTCIEYIGKRVPHNYSHADAEPSMELVTHLGTLCANALTLAHNRTTIDIELDDEASTFVHEFDLACDLRVNGSDSEVARQMWTRAHMKLLKLAGLIAVGCDIFHPTITLDIAKWTANLIERDVANILQRFEAGAVGNSNSEQQQAIRMMQICKDYVYRPFDSALFKYGVNESLHRDRIIQWSYLSKRLIGQPAFKTDRMGSNFAMRRTIEALISDGTITEISGQQLQTRYRYLGKAYVITDLSKLG